MEKADKVIVRERGRKRARESENVKRSVCLLGEGGRTVKRLVTVFHVYLTLLHRIMKLQLDTQNKQLKLWTASRYPQLKHQLNLRNC